MVRLPVQNPAPEQPDMSKHTQDVLFQARTIQKERSDSYISQDALILALVQKDTAVARAFKEAGVSEAQLKNAISDVRGSKRVESKQAEQGSCILQRFLYEIKSNIQRCRLRCP